MLKQLNYGLESTVSAHQVTFGSRSTHYHDGKAAYEEKEGSTEKLRSHNDLDNNKRSCMKP